MGRLGVKEERLGNKNKGKPALSHSGALAPVIKYTGVYNIKLIVLQLRYGISYSLIRDFSKLDVLHLSIWALSHFTPAYFEKD